MVASHMYGRYFILDGVSSNVDHIISRTARFFESSAFLVGRSRKAVEETVKATRETAKVTHETTKATDFIWCTPNFTLVYTNAQIGVHQILH